MKPERRRPSEPSIKVKAPRFRIQLPRSEETESSNDVFSTNDRYDISLENLSQAINVIRAETTNQQSDGMNAYFDAHQNAEIYTQRNAGLSTRAFDGSSAQNYAASSAQVPASSKSLKTDDNSQRLQIRTDKVNTQGNVAHRMSYPKLNYGRGDNWLTYQDPDTEKVWRHFNSIACNPPGDSWPIHRSSNDRVRVHEERQVEQRVHNRVLLENNNAVRSSNTHTSTDRRANNIDILRNLNPSRTSLSRPLNLPTGNINARFSNLHPTIQPPRFTSLYKHLIDVRKHYGAMTTNPLTRPLTEQELIERNKMYGGYLNMTCQKYPIDRYLPRMPPQMGPSSHYGNVYIEPNPATGLPVFYNSVLRQPLAVHDATPLNVSPSARPEDSRLPAGE